MKIPSSAQARKESVFPMTDHQLDFIHQLAERLLSSKGGQLYDRCFDHLAKSHCFGGSDDWIYFFAAVWIVTG